MESRGPFGATLAEADGAGHRSLRTKLHQRLERVPERPRHRAVLDGGAIRDALGILGGPTSPLRRVLRLVAEHTSFVQPADTPTPRPRAAEPSRLQESAGIATRGRGKTITGRSGCRVPAGTRVSERFQPIHRLMAGAPAPIDTVLEQVRKIRDQLLKSVSRREGRRPLSALTDQALFDLMARLQQDAANLPPPVNALVAQIAPTGQAPVSETDATGQLEQEYQEASSRRAGPVWMDAIHSAHELAPMTWAISATSLDTGGCSTSSSRTNSTSWSTRSQRPWSWRQESVEPPLVLLEPIRRARRTFVRCSSRRARRPRRFSSMSTFRTSTRPRRVSTSTSTGRLQTSRRATEARTVPEWPGPKPGRCCRRISRIRWRRHLNRRRQSTGPWAWFQLIDAGSTSRVRAPACWRSDEVPPGPRDGRRRRAIQQSSPRSRLAAVQMRILSAAEGASDRCPRSSRSVESVEVGLFGKLPSHGDFLRRRASDAFVDTWDAWLRECLAASRAALGERWLDVYLTSPAWRFCVRPGPAARHRSSA